MVISMEEGLIQWFKLELPPEIVGDKEPTHDRKLKVLDEVEYEFNLDLQIGETGEQEFIAHMHYTQSFNKLVMGTHTGLFGRLELQAE